MLPVHAADGAGSLEVHLVQDRLPVDRERLRGRRCVDLREPHRSEGAAEHVGVPTCASRVTTGTSLPTKRSNRTPCERTVPFSSGTRAFGGRKNTSVTEVSSRTIAAYPSVVEFPSICACSASRESRISIPILRETISNSHRYRTHVTSDCFLDLLRRQAPRE